MLNTNRVLALALILPMLACDKGSSPSTPPDTAGAGEPTAAADAAPAATEAGAETEETEPGAPNIVWQDKTFKQRQTFMGVFFLKEMKKGFKGHDESLYAGFKCQTCHGDDMKERNFAMPTDSIYPLNAEDPVGAANDYDAEVTKFMVEWVVPTSAELLDQEPYNPETKTGTFGCFSCHPKE